MSILKNTKGFTLIELILVVSIVGLVIVSVGNYLITNLNSFNTDVARLDAQEETQEAMKALTTLALNSSGVEAVGSSTYPSITDITFKMPESPPDDENKIQLVGNALSSSLTGVLATDITSLTMIPIPDPERTLADSDYLNAQGLTITIVSQKNGQQSSLTNQVYFRNK